MYEVYLDEQMLYYPGDEVYSIQDPVVKLKIGQAGSFECMVPSGNPVFSQINNRKSLVSVMRNNKEIFYGEIREQRKDRHNRKRIYAVGALAFLADSIQPQHNYGDCTPYAFLSGVLANHNAQVEARKQIQVGTVTASVGYQYGDKITDYEDTLTAIRTQLVDNIGGCLRIRRQGGVTYLDYVTLSDYGQANTQGINFGENLLDYAEDFTAADIATVVIPRGARTDPDNDFEKRIDIKSVNGGVEYITAGNVATTNFGFVWKTVVFDEIEDPAELKTAGQQWLSERQYETLTLKVTAVDLSYMDANIDDMNLGDRIPCYAPPYGMSMTLPIQEQTLNLQAPQKDTVTLCATMKNNKALSAQVSSGSSETKRAAYKQELQIINIIRQEAAALMATFTGSMGGYKLSEYDSNGLWIRDLYMDTTDKTTATNILEISMRGIRSSTQGYKDPSDPAWKLGITIDGQINASRILTGTLLASLIKVGILSDALGNNSWNMETGAFTAQSFSLDTPYIAINGSGKITSKNTNEDLTIEQGIIKGWVNGNLLSTIDMCADFADGSVAPVFRSEGDLYLEIGGGGSLYIMQGNNLCGMIDGNGWHGNTSPT